MIDGSSIGWRRARGLTLIELMVVVAVIAILATIVVPAYENQIRSARRADGRSIATAVALALERRFSVYQRYKDADGAATLDVQKLVDEAGLENTPNVLAKKSQGGFYSWDVAFGAAGEPPFTITVTPVAGKSQAEDKYCTQKTLNSFGAKGGTAVSGYEVRCWP